MKKFTNAAAASVLAGAIVLSGTPAQAAETADTETAATTTTAAEKPAKEKKEELTWQERNERAQAQIDITSQRLDNAKKGLEVTDGIINSSSNLKDLFTPRIVKDGGLSTLLKTGSDDFDFWTQSDSGERLRHIGRDDLTGTVEIDGERLDTTRFTLRTFAETGELLIERSGTQFVSRSLGRFFGGVETSTDWTGETQETNDSPVRFIRPGEPGFGSVTPDYDCDLQMAGMPAGGGA